MSTHTKERGKFNDLRPLQLYTCFGYHVTSKSIYGLERGNPSALGVCVCVRQFLFFILTWSEPPKGGRRLFDLNCQ